MPHTTLRCHFGRIIELRDLRASFAICTVVAASGSTPRKPGARMLVHDDGSQEGTIGGGAIEFSIVKDALRSIATGTPLLIERHLTHELAMCCGGKMSVFIEPQHYLPRFYMFGCGHVGRPLAEMAALSGFEVTAVDHRPELANPDAFFLSPAAVGSLKIISCDPLDAIERLKWDCDDTFVAVATHDHALDERIVDAVLSHPFTWLGCIGSVRKALKFRARLKALGWTEKDINKMRTPMGLDISAELPEEIAVSTLAEMIAIRRGEASNNHPSVDGDGDPKHDNTGSHA